jgi:glycosyltransferase involved in cell wall biosynthesis
MIVRNEAHIVHETLDAAAPYISYWVIVDTGSEDGTQDAIRDRMALLGIPGELHERPWLNFGHNRTEALELARGRGEYIWVIDADDTVSGTMDLGRLGADVYALRYTDTNGDSYWMPQIFRDSVPVRYVGIVHEHAVWDESFSLERLPGAYHINSRRLGGRNLDGHKHERDRDLLLAEVERNPADSRSVFYLAQSYWCLDDFENALRWYRRRGELGGWAEEVYFSLLRVAESMRNLGHPWPDVQDAYLRAWEYRPIRAEPLYCLASYCRVDGRHQLGYEYARLATEIPFPDSEALFVRQSVYHWRAQDDQAVCASWTGRLREAFGLWRTLIAKPEVPEGDRDRMATNRDICVPAMLESAVVYPAEVVRCLTTARTDADTTVTMVAGTDTGRLHRTLNTFLNCCLDAVQRARFVVVDTGLSAEDLAQTVALYPFLTFQRFSSATEPDVVLSHLLPQLGTSYWLHLPEGAQFFAPEALITRLVAVLTAEPQVFQVGINFSDEAELTGKCAPEAIVRRAPGAGRYLRTARSALGPALFDTGRLKALQFGAELGTASLDEVLCFAM